MKTLRLLVALAVVAGSLTGCCGAHPVRDRWCESWGYPPAAPYYQQPYQQQQPCCTQPVR